MHFIAWKTRTLHLEDIEQMDCNRFDDWVDFFVEFNTKK